MRASAKVAMALIVAAGLGTASYVFLFPKIGRATRTEIQAVLPASLRVVDSPHKAEASRYVRLLGLLQGLDKERSGIPPQASARNEAVLGKVEALVGEGALWAPVQSGKAAVNSLSDLRNGARAFSAEAEAARKRGDRAACARWTISELRYAQAIEAAGGVVIDQLVAIAVNAIALRTAYLEEIKGGLDRAGREAVLAAIPPSDGTSPEMADALRRDYQNYLLPTIQKPDSIERTVEGTPDFVDGEPQERHPLVGTFDPVATARLTGSVYEALIADAQLPMWKARHGEQPLLERAGKGLPEMPRLSDGTRDDRFWPQLRYRCAMNSGQNTLGRLLASATVLTSLGAATATEAATRNIVRTIFEVRMGRTAAELDPFCGRPLRVDPKRKIVWSVGRNRKDDGGAIGVGGNGFERDFGYPYGDHSFQPHPRPRIQASHGALNGTPPVPPRML